MRPCTRLFNRGRAQQQRMSPTAVQVPHALRKAFKIRMFPVPNVQVGTLVPIPSRTKGVRGSKIFA
ncbi:hypothetical protein XAP412_840002 [Xanthomonas phaseoli pv. phaseoli]|uniref:Transposase n=1 Tax=Xanthomonas campestris pv. phaseoli TaxID=317013 RepID=A0AB38E5G8_XANCH|nr:hypothetical protein XAP6984_870002 [Xanthomonas phaseoli pv. phaseoli]SON90911.1 hypothetical protein XAP412_840002 [Xanthomonas phaseoli pv. phaseoli]SON92706.1 hypothetical protein XAP7430_850002 [Xanthomonas phaseoli pv. phaseoli]